MPEVLNIKPWGGEGRGMSVAKKFEISGEGFEGFF